MVTAFSLRFVPRTSTGAGTQDESGIDGPLKSRHTVGKAAAKTNLGASLQTNKQLIFFIHIEKLSSLPIAKARERWGGSTFILFFAHLCTKIPVSVLESSEETSLPVLPPVKASLPWVCVLDLPHNNRSLVK